MNECTITKAGDLWGRGMGTTSDCGSACNGSEVSGLGPRGLESHGSVSDLSVSLLQFQSAESQSWGKGLPAYGEGAALGEEGGQSR